MLVAPRARPASTGLPRDGSAERRRAGRGALGGARPRMIQVKPKQMRSICKYECVALQSVPSSNVARWVRAATPARASGR